MAGLVLACVFWAALVRWEDRQRAAQHAANLMNAFRTVEIDDVWELRNHPRHSGLYVAVGPERLPDPGAKSDRWVMTRIRWDVVTKRWVIAGPMRYMTRRERMLGDWVFRATSETEATAIQTAPGQA